MDTIFQTGLTVVSILGIIFLIVSTFLLCLLTVMFFKVYRFMKKQKALFDVVGKFSSYLTLFKRKG